MSGLICNACLDAIEESNVWRDRDRGGAWRVLIKDYGITPDGMRHDRLVDGTFACLRRDTPDRPLPDSFLVRQGDVPERP